MSNVKNKKVFVAMSGGVDSSVAAALLKEQGYEVVGAHMKCYNVDGCAEQDAEDARRAAEVLGIPFYVFDFEKEYKEKVVEYMVEGYRQGITPNPDVMCNKEIKFGLFLRKALAMGADFVATGHYVRLDERKNFISSTRSSATADSLMLARFADRAPLSGAKTIGPGKAAARVSENKAFSLFASQDSRFTSLSMRIDQKKLFPTRQRAKYFLERSPSPKDESAERAWREGLRSEATKSPERKCCCRLEKVFSLSVAKDKNKDQSYFLWTLTQEQLRHCLFPIGDYLKSGVRQMARQFGLPNAEKKDSQGICFLGQVTLKDFLGNYLPEKRGLVLNTAGEIVGEHNGAHFYTIGQRHLGIKNYELGIKGQNERRPSYVAEKDIKTNTLLVAEGDDNPALFCKEVRLKNINLINPIIHNSKFTIPVFARVRYRQPLVKALFIIHNSLFKLVFDHSQKFVAPGQSAVFYSQAGEILGGGTIDK